MRRQDMIKRLGYTALMATALVVVGAQLPAQAAPAPDAKPATSAAAADPNINPEAMAALNAMGAHLRALKAFQVIARITRDDVLDDGQLIQYDTNVNLLARTPDRLRVETTNSRKHRLYFFDGKTFTLYARA